MFYNRLTPRFIVDPFFNSYVPKTIGGDGNNVIGISQANNLHRYHDSS